MHIAIHEAWIYISHLNSIIISVKLNFCTHMLRMLQIVACSRVYIILFNNIIMVITVQSHMTVCTKKGFIARQQSTFYTSNSADYTNSCFVPNISK